MIEAQDISRTRLGFTLQRIAEDIVQALGYVGSMVAILEADGSLPVYALYVDPALMTRDQIRSWQEKISKTIRREVDIFNPEFAKVNVNDEAYADNLSFQAVRKKRQIVRNDLSDLFVPILPNNKLVRETVNKLIQPALKIEQVVAVPFFLDSPGGGEPQVLGNLFAAKSSKITPQDIQILTSYGRHAAAAIELERQRSQTLQVARQLTTNIQTRIRQRDEVLQQIAESVVKVLGYVGAMVATYEEEEGALPVRAFHFDPGLLTIEQIDDWQRQLSKVLRRDVNIFDPEFARVYIYDEQHMDNLGVQAVRQREPVVANNLSALFAPIIPINALTRPIVDGIVQRALKIKQVIAVPFFLQDAADAEPKIVGNLFAATVHPLGFQLEEIELLQAFGQQAAAGIFYAKLFYDLEQAYKKAEERREAATIFGTMAFSASKSVHQFRNHIGFIRGQLQLLPYIEQFSEADRQEIIKSTPRVIERLNIIAEILNQLHEPWRPINVKSTDINTCLVNARNKVIPEHATEGVKVELQLAADLPQITTSSDMLTETFVIIIKNGVEAIHARGGEDKYLRISSQYAAPAILIDIEDNGTGIEPENLEKIFEMRWTTKTESGLGFGLFWARDYIEGLGGHIDVQSEWLKGSTFRVLLPVQEVVLDGERGA
ncbi:MAG: GAF domain-containing protein [Ardenticatenaceae bacterium]|nr:GAF domain-containing protein [Ardenticatenaceae bacterium]MCB8989098.1 GAF domain-containing protein [Ardenticatenaceae bacterium]